MVPPFASCSFMLAKCILRKPLPLTTVDLQKAGSRLLRMSPKKVLDVSIREDTRPIHQL